MARSDGTVAARCHRPDPAVERRSGSVSQHGPPLPAAATPHRGLGAAISRSGTSGASGRGPPERDRPP